MAVAKFKVNLRSMIGIHQNRERFDVLLTVVLPLFLMVVSSYTNAWAFTGGHLSLESAEIANTLIATFKGLFVEALVFCFFRFVKILCSLGWRYTFAALVPFLVGLFGVVVSAGCGLAWAAKSGEMNFLVGAVTTYMSPSLANVFKAGMGMLFPVALAVLAVYDPKHMIKEHMESGSELAVMAMKVENAEHHQNMLREAQKVANQDQSIKEAYKRMAANNAQQAVTYAEQGDYSFGLKTEPLQLPARHQSSVTRITPAATAPALAAPQAPPFPGLPVPNQPTIIPGQVTQNAPFTGTTQQLNVGGPVPVPPAPPQKRGLFGQLANWSAGN
ncbi:hypothetical protein [Dictyobacter aurantiacus]|uniref:Uncharacterized protein n=1 Tax=Dictyobacter aurantiacus TaxID=1936993 RepID=A0A401ZHN0_9CHLR|nr:hypothetical protein [Dictyobacter aurantiacus]GCE06346.1 hypothetical protein KDAU_36750 [Dictyobacter aurantiacus]